MTPREPDLVTHQFDYLRGILVRHGVPEPLRGRLIDQARAGGTILTGQLIGAAKYQPCLRDALAALYGVVRDADLRKAIRAELAVVEAAQKAAMDESALTAAQPFVQRPVALPGPIGEALRRDFGFPEPGLDAPPPLPVEPFEEPQ